MSSRLEQIHARSINREVSPATTEAQKQQYALQAFYDIVINESLGQMFSVSPCDRNADEIRELEAAGRMLVYVHPELSTPEGFPLLRATLPGLEVSTFKGDYINQTEQHGWLDVEKSFETPHVGVSPAQLRKDIKEEGVEGQTVNTYVLASELSRFISGRYFDPYDTGGIPAYKTSSLLLGSKESNEPGKPLIAGYSDGESIRIRSYYIPHRTKNEYYGARTVGGGGVLVVSAQEVENKSVTVERLVEALGYGEGIDSLEATIRILNLLERQYGLTGVKTNTVIPVETLTAMRQDLTRSEVISTLEEHVEERSYISEKDADIPLDVLAEIDAEFGGHAPSKSTTVFQQKDVQVIPTASQEISGQQSKAEEAQFNAVDVLREVVGSIPSGVQRSKAKNIAREKGWDPDKLTEKQRITLFELLKEKFLK